MSQYLTGQGKQREQRRLTSETDKQYETDEYMPGGTEEGEGGAGVVPDEAPVAWEEPAKDRTRAVPVRRCPSKSMARTQGRPGPGQKVPATGSGKNRLGNGTGIRKIHKIRPGPIYY